MDRTGSTRLSCALAAFASLGAVSLAHADARVRVIHASPDAPAVDVLVNGGVAFANLAFTGSTDYATLPAGTYDVQVVPAGQPGPVVIDADLVLADGADYTVLAIDELAQITPLVLVDDNTLDAENARVRFVHASPNAPAVDIALANGGPVLFADVEFGEAAPYLAVPPGTYDLEARLAGTSTVVLSVPGVALERATVATVSAMGLVGGTPPLQAVLDADARATARVRVVHASPDAPSVDVRVNGAVAFPSLPFNGVTGYAELPYGTYDVEVVPAGQAGPVVIDAQLALEPFADLTVLAVNELAQIAPLVLVDDNRTRADAGKIRFVHASPNAPAVDIALANGGPVLFGDVAYTEVGDYLPVPEGVYDLEVRLAGTSTVVLDLPGIGIAQGTVSTAFATGLVGGTPALGAILSEDAARCPGDVNGDAGVGVMDLMSVLSTWGECGLCDTDLDASDTVDFIDLLLVLTNWGDC